MKQKRKSIQNLICILIAFAVVIYVGFSIMEKSDMNAFLLWWLTLLVLGIGFLPLTGLFFSRFKDKGWLFSKTIGLAISGWLMWYLSSFHILKFTYLNCYLVTAFCFLLNILLLFLQKKHEKKTFDEGNLTLHGAMKIQTKPFFDFRLENLNSALVAELLFFAAFLFWTYLRCFKPQIMGNTEKFMDYGLMVSLDNAIYMPAEDIWLSGETINYYYLGQYLCTFLKRLSGVAMEKSYTLSLMMIAGLAFAMPYSLVNQVATDYVKRKRIRTKNSIEWKEEKAKALFGPLVGLVAGISVCFAGNMHYPIVNGLAMKSDKLCKLLSIERDFYWFPDATRFIGYAPETKDKTIHEFPCYSFVLGDLHAHVINILFVLTVLAILYTILQKRSKAMLEYRFEPDMVSPFPKNKEELLFEIFLPQVLLIGFFIGIFHMTNYWDFPIYFVVSGAILLFSNAVICHFRKQTLFLTFAHAVVVLLISTIVSLPFRLSFDQISTGISICLNHSRLYQLAILWGLPIVSVLSFLVLTIRRFQKEGKPFEKKKQKKASTKVTKEENKELEKRENEEDAINQNKNFREEHPWLDWLYRFLSSLEISDLFVITIGLCACGLILLPELVYVKDIYSGDHKRANTMFKLTYQAYIMFGMCMPYIIFRLIRFREKKSQIIFPLILLCLLWSTFGYFSNATKAWFGDVKDKTLYQGLDCIEYMKNFYPEDYEAVNWIRQNIQEPSVIVENVGYSYTYFERISSATGHATMIGWETHEWLWRSEAQFEKPEVISKRQQDVKNLYTATNRDDAINILKEYDVDYLFVGALERVNGLTNGNKDQEGYVRNYADERYYQKWDIDDELLRSLGEVVYQAKDENGSIRNEEGEYRTYIVKINK